MWLVLAAMRRPITILVAVISVALASIMAIQQMKVDIFPKLGAPAIYVAQPYGGMDPSQMEGYLTYYYEYHFLYITGIEHVESKNIQGIALMKLVFHPDTDMSQAMAEVVSYVNRARAFMPPGAVPPFVMRYDAGSVPVAQLVFSSATRAPGEMQDIALNRVRPIFATLPGVSAPPPFGGSQRTIVVRVDPERLREYRLSPEEVVFAVSRASTVVPSGNVRTGDLIRIASTNATLGGNIQELLDAPLRVGTGPTIYLRDVGTINDTTDIVVGYAHVNGKRTVYVPVTKRADASTLDVIRSVRQALPAMRNVAPDDVNIDLVFDQSRYVVNALRGLVTEGLLGAVLTGLVVLLFLRDLRSALIVTATIPFALLSAVVCLWITGQTINIMTLGGLALAVGILVDTATVSIESIHTHLVSGLSRARAAFEASLKTALPRLLAMLCVLAVFMPSFFMVGTARQLFVPLSLAVGFAMLASYLLSSTLVPVLSTWMIRAGHHDEAGFFDKLRSWYRHGLESVLRVRWAMVAGYLVATGALIYILLPRLGTEIFPKVETHQIQLRLRAPTGTRLERTELIALKAMDVIKDFVGPNNVDITTSFIGVQTPNYPINTIYLFASGQHEAVLGVALKPTAPPVTDALKEHLRRALHEALPQVAASFEAADIISQVMSFGSPTPIEVAVQGPSLAVSRPFAETLYAELAKVDSLRDLQYAQPLDYPSLQIQIDRNRAGQFGVTTADVARSLVAATSSSRYTDLNFWRDPGSGNGFQIQVEIPQSMMASLDDVAGLPVMPRNSVTGISRPLVADVASVDYGTTLGEVDRYNMQRVVSFTANLEGKPLGQTLDDVRQAIARAGAPPRGVTVHTRGQVPAFEETLSGLRSGLLLSIVVIFLLLAANFQSFRLAIAVVSTVPAVICGVLLMLFVTGTTLNVQSFMGAIMAVGISVANAILLVTFAEDARRERAVAAATLGQPEDNKVSVLSAAVEGARGRLRAILMTASAMIAGMIPMALGTGEQAQSAPLGRAVIGGLSLATLATLLILPAVYTILQARARTVSPSLHHDDPASAHYEPRT
ncbi:MAG: efflux RND transporter permease subunit [Acidobacteria bacterium]|nr:efflux RND transporter permease subunit [Acidobacteriota bacterium]